MIDSPLSGTQSDSVFLTVDIDWAPDYMLAPMIDVLEKHNLTATIFATHKSPLLEMIEKRGIHEIGLHPNLCEGSSQGKSLDEVMRTLSDVASQPKGVRFHRLGHEYRDLVRLQDYGITYDVSRLNFNCSHLRPTFHHDLNLTLLTYSWEDGVAEGVVTRGGDAFADIESPGIKILNFHPLNVYMNFANSLERELFQSEHPRFSSLPESALKPRNRKAGGSGDVFEEVCARLAESGAGRASLESLVKT